MEKPMPNSPPNPTMMAVLGKRPKALPYEDHPNPAAPGTARAVTKAVMNKAYNHLFTCSPLHRAAQPKPDKSRAYNHRLQYFSPSRLSDDDEDSEVTDDVLCSHYGGLPLTCCGGGGEFWSGRGDRPLTLKEVLRSSVQVLGMGGLGVTEKVVLREGVSYAAKRFRKILVGRSEFGRRIEGTARISKQNCHLAPVRAYLYSKRVKLVLYDYYPMGSLADLLAGARERGHTGLDWPTRARIIFHVARAISYIHTQSPGADKRFRMDVHGNIKASNVFINTDFSACLSDYGFIHLAGPSGYSGGPVRLSTHKEPQVDDPTGKKPSQESDIFSFGMMVVDVLGGPRAPYSIGCVMERKEDIKEGRVHFFETPVEGRAKEQASQVLEVALDCINTVPEARPSATEVLVRLKEALSSD